MTLEEQSIFKCVLVELADRAEVVHVTVTLTQTSFKEDVKERVIKQKPVTLEDV